MRDGDIRTVLRARLNAEHSADPTTLVLDELGIACSSARVDLAVINGSMLGYEIKSDVDSLTRLPAQARVYDQVLDYTTLVAGSRHFDHASTLVPTHWGLMRAVVGARSLELVPERSASFNTVVEPRALAMMLWRAELVDGLKEKGAYRGLSSKPIGALWDRLVEVTEVDQLRELVRRRIKARGNWRVDRSRLQCDG